MDIAKYNFARVNNPLNFIFSLIWWNLYIVLCSTEHGLLRAKDQNTYFLINSVTTQSSNLSGNPVEVEQSTLNPFNLSTGIAANDSSTTSQDKLESFLEALNQTSAVGVLSLDYELESDTNKTKRSKSPIRWLKSTLGFGDVSSGNQPKSELMEGQSDLQRESMGDSSETPLQMESGGDGSILSKLNPFTKIKRKLSSKVSTVSNTAGQVYQTIAGKVGLGSNGSGSGNTETGASDADMGDNGSNSGMRDKEEDEESSAHQFHAPLAIWISTFSLIVSFSL